MSARTILKHVYNNGGMTEAQYQKIDRNLKERPHGTWEGTPERKSLIIRRCNVCGERGAVGNFCWWCGADMRKEGDKDASTR